MSRRVWLRAPTPAVLPCILLPPVGPNCLVTAAATGSCDFFFLFVFDAPLKLSPLEAEDMPSDEPRREGPPKSTFFILGGFLAVFAVDAALGAATFDADFAAGLFDVAEDLASGAADFVPVFFDVAAVVVFLAGDFFATVFFDSVFLAMVFRSPRGGKFTISSVC